MNTINLRINHLAIEFFNGNNVKFAVAVESSEANIRNYRKNGQPKLEFIVKTCEVLNINFEWLLTGKGDKFHNEYLQKEEPLQKVEEPLEEINYQYEKMVETNELEKIPLFNKIIELQEEKIQKLEDDLKKCEAEKKLIQITK